VFLKSLQQYFIGGHRKHSVSSKTKRRRDRQLFIETLEDKRLLAVVWANQGSSVNDSDRFELRYGADVAPLARQIVSRAIEDWNAVITDSNLSLSVLADPLAGRGGTGGVLYSNGRPISANISLDDNGGGVGWYFDQTPLDDAEFTAIANTDTTSGTSFQASFIDVAAGAPISIGRSLTKLGMHSDLPRQALRSR
jgi:hypothetical protein